MRKFVAYFLTAILTLSGLLTPGLLGEKPAYAQAAAPFLKGLRPDTITAGSDSFTFRVEGNSFHADAKILFDGVALPSPRVFRKGKTIYAELEASLIAAAGTHTVQILNPDGQRSATSTFTVVNREPTLRMRLGGNAVQEEVGTNLEFDVTGEGFEENSTAIIWGFDAVITTFVNSEKLTVQIAEDLLAEPATIPIYIRNKGGKISNTENFFVVPRPARIESIDPQTLDTEPAEDFLLTVRGNFKPSAYIVVNGTRFETTQRKEGRLEAMIPASFRAQPSQLIVRVEQDGVQSRDELLTVAPTEGPFIFNLAPSRFRIGENKPTLDIYGANMGDKVTVTINGEEAKIRASTKTVVTIVLTEPIRSTPGTYTLQVKDEDGKLSLTASFEVVPDYEVSTLSGDGREGFVASGCIPGDAARFRRPRRIAVGPDHLLYITDQQNHAIRTLNPTTGEVCTIAGTGEFGYKDSADSAAPPAFSFPNGVAVASNGTIYVTENGNNVVRRIVRTANGVTVDTIAGTTEPITGSTRQTKLNATREGLDGFREGPANNAAFRKPDEIVVAPDGSLYFTDPNNHSIRRITQNGSQFFVETVAGNGVPGFIDGALEVARFNTPTGLAISSDGRLLYVADTANNRIRRINLLTQRVETLAGNGDFAGLDGPAGLANLAQPIGVALDANGVLYVSEFGAFRIRRIDAAGNVSTVAGTGGTKFKDGVGLKATFNAPRGLAIDGGFLYVADYENLRIRKIALQ